MSLAFCPLWARSSFSLLTGVAPPEALLAAAKAAGYRRLGILDVNGFYGLIWTLQEARELGVELVIGAELRHGGRRAAAIALSVAGYQALCRAITALHRDPAFDLLSTLRALPPDVALLLDEAALLEALRDRPETYAAIGPAGFSFYQWAKKLGVPAVAAWPQLYLHPEQPRVMRLLRAIANNTTLARVPENEVPGLEALLPSPREAAEKLAFCPEALEAAERLAARACHDPGLGATIFPGRARRPGEAAELLRARCLARVPWRYGRLTDEIRRRLDYEMAIIEPKGFAEVFLLAEQIARRATLTCGRGSAAASIVSYLLGITHVDPLRHDLFFDRFLNPGREDPPDIDIDFAWDERDDVIHWVLEHFGAGRVAMVASQIGFRSAAAVREIAKVYGLPDEEIGRVTGRMSGYWLPRDAARVVREHPLFKDLRLEDPWPEILGLAALLEGHPRYLSVHPGGVVIVPGGVDRVVPVQDAPKGVPIIQWEKDQAEDAGLVKMDILGNRSLAVIRDALASIARRENVHLSYASFNPLDDPATKDLLARGDSVGVFYVESPAMRQLQIKCGTGEYERLVVHSSIIRPAANEYIDEYVRRLRGGRWEPLHPALEAQLAETFGIMVYQEDVAKAGMTIAGFDAAKADGLRKVMSKKRSGKKFEDYRRDFFAGALARGEDPAVVEKIWRMIESFAGYSFCKPHSASYALVSFKSAHLKAHYPAAFIAAVISNQGGYYGTFAYVSEARRLGLRVLGPDINESEREWIGQGDWVRAGLMQLRELPAKALEQILAARRRGGPFADFAAFVTRCPLDPAAVRILIRGGCFDGLHTLEKRPRLMWELARYAHGREAPARRQANLSLFAEKPAGPLPTPPPYDEVDVLRQEVETLGFLASRHPLDLYRTELSHLKHVPAAELSRHVGRTVTVVGWLVTGKTVATKKGEPMEFVSFEDTTALYETTFFPKAYAKFCHLLTRTRPYLLTGRVEESFGAVSLNVQWVRLLGDAPPAERVLATRGRAALPVGGEG